MWNSLNARVCCPPPAIIVFWCRTSASRSSPVLLFFFLHAWFVVIVFLRVLVSLFLISSPKCPRRWWETRPRPRWARSHPPPPVLHWLRDILISGISHTSSHFMIVCQVWNLYLMHLLLIDSLNPPLELQRRIWTHSALWTRRGLSKDTHLFQTYRKSVLGQKKHNTGP